MAHLVIEIPPYGLTDHELSIDYGCVFFRTVHNDVNVSNWVPIADFDGRTYKELNDYLTMLYYGEDPQLKRAFLRDLPNIFLEDRYRYQYYGVEAIPENL
jgi:hypothetical protein